MSRENKLQEYLLQKKELYEQLLLYIDTENEFKGYFENLINIIYKQNIPRNITEFKLLIQLIIDISNNHYDLQHFLFKIEKLFQHFEKELKKTFSNLEIFNLCKSNMLIILSLLNMKIIEIDSNIANLIMNTINENSGQCYFFYPEIKQYIDKDMKLMIEDKLLKEDSQIFENFEEKRKKGENESYISSIIRNDSIDEFIVYINKKDLKFSSKIQKSIFETNRFLIKNNPTLIEYAFFYGSIKIIRYLIKNDSINSISLWIYAIHSNKSEVIHLLEENYVIPQGDAYINCFIESIKCHHNDLANYILKKYIDNKQNKVFECNKIIQTILHHCNYCYLSSVNFKDISNASFYSLFKYDHLQLVRFYLEKKRNKNIQPIISFIISQCFNTKKKKFYTVSNIVIFNGIRFILNEIQYFIFQFS